MNKAELVPNMIKKICKIKSAIVYQGVKLKESIQQRLYVHGSCFIKWQNRLCVIVKGSANKRDLVKYIGH